MRRHCHLISDPLLDELYNKRIDQDDIRLTVHSKVATLAFQKVSIRGDEVRLILFVPIVRH